VEASLPEQLVSDADHLSLSWLVVEIAWRIDHSQADRVPEGPARQRRTGSPHAVQAHRDRKIAAYGEMFRSASRCRLGGSFDRCGLESA